MRKSDVDSDYPKKAQFWITSILFDFCFALYNSFAIVQFLEFPKDLIDLI